MGCQWGLLGLKHLRVPVQSSPWPRTRGQPFIRVHPSAHSRDVCLARCVPRGRTLRAQLLPCKDQGQEVLVPFLGFSASWDTQGEHQGTLLAASRRHRGLWARKAAPASAAAVILGCEHSPAGNAPLQAGPALTLSRRTFAMDQVNPQDSCCSFLPGKGHGTSTFTAVG